MKDIRHTRQTVARPALSHPALDPSLAPATEALWTPVSSIMSRELICAGFDMSLETLTPLLVEKDLACALVVEDGKLVGLVSLADLLLDHFEYDGISDEGPLRVKTRHGVEYDPGHGFHAVEIARKTVADVMTARPTTVSPETSIGMAAALMASKSLPEIAVVEVDGTVAGILTAVDVLRWLSRMYGFAIAQADPAVRVK